MAQDTVILTASAQRSERISGRFFTVLSATAKFDVELDGRKRRTVGSGDKISDERFRRISFFETAGAANTIVFDAGDEEYQGNITSTQKVSGTYAYGNAGHPQFPQVNAAKKGLSNWLYSTTTVPTNLASQGILISGTNAGNRRKQITIQNTTLNANPFDLMLFDVSGNPFLRVKPNDTPYTWETSADIYLLGYNGDIGAGLVIINEIFYSNV